MTNFKINGKIFYLNNNIILVYQQDSLLDKQKLNFFNF
jgi:hypothetical protein